MLKLKKLLSVLEKEDLIQIDVYYPNKDKEFIFQPDICDRLKRMNLDWDNYVVVDYQYDIFYSEAIITVSKIEDFPMLRSEG